MDSIQETMFYINHNLQIVVIEGLTQFNMLSKQTFNYNLIGKRINLRIITLIISEISCNRNDRTLDNV